MPVPVFIIGISLGGIPAGNVESPGKKGEGRGGKGRKRGRTPGNSLFPLVRGV